MARIYLITTIVLFACISQPSDRVIEDRALRIVKQFKDSSLSIFFEWNYFSRGGENWIKKSGDSSLFSCSYLFDEDTTTLIIYHAESFILEFPCSFEFDTTNYWRFYLKRFNDSIVDIEGASNGGPNFVLATNQKINALFKVSNPYDLFDSLTMLKNRLNVIGISSNNSSDKGKFIQFYLSRQHILTYFQDTIPFESKYWKGGFSNGKKLNNHWNFRKLDNPIDNG